MKVNIVPNPVITYRITLDVTTEEMSLLKAMFAADTRIPNLLVEAGDIRTYDNCNDLGKLMNQVYRAIFDLWRTSKIG